MSVTHNRGSGIIHMDTAGDRVDEMLPISYILLQCGATAGSWTCLDGGGKTIATPYTAANDSFPLPMGRSIQGFEIDALPTGGKVSIFLKKR